MQSDLSTVLAFLLFLFTRNCLAMDACYKSGTTWADLGDDSAIADAFHSLCENMAGTYKLKDQVSQGRPRLRGYFRNDPQEQNANQQNHIDRQLREHQRPPHPGCYLAH